MKERILCMYSGGLDSTGVLYKLLTEDEYSKYDIHVHNIALINKENRQIPETNAVNSCLLWFKKNCRNFYVTRNVIDFSFLRNNFPWDMDIISFVSAEILLNSNEVYSSRAIGKTKTDIDIGLRDVSVSTNIFNIMLSGTSKSADKIFPVSDMTKKEIWNMLPEELREYTWSCRTPRFIGDRYFYCGGCKTCNSMKKEGIISKNYLNSFKIQNKL